MRDRSEVDTRDRYQERRRNSFGRSGSQFSAYSDGHAGYPEHRRYPEQGAGMDGLRNGNGFGQRVKNHRSSMSCQDFGGDALVAQNFRKRTTDLVRDRRSISRDAHSLDLMGVSPDRLSDDVVKMHENFQSHKVLPQKEQLSHEVLIKDQSSFQSNLAQNSQIEQFTQLLSQLNMNLVNSQLTNFATQKAISTDKPDIIETQASTEAGTKPKKTSISKKDEETKQELDKQQSQAKPKAVKANPKQAKTKPKQVKPQAKAPSPVKPKEPEESKPFSNLPTLKFLSKIYFDSLTQLSHFFRT